MSKIIRMTPEMIEESKRKFEARLKNMNLANGTLTYTETFQTTNQKAVVWYTPDAYTKMIALIQDSEKEEVAWHGIAHRLETPGQYVISDILVYPQEVTGATVNTDQAEYENWIMGLEDETFDNLRMHGHSHVRMDCHPSPTDLEHQAKIIEQLEGDMFYIFMIWNKYFKFTAKIYDLKLNTLFEQGDITIKMVGGGAGLGEFLEESRKMVKTKTFSGNGCGNNYQGGYNGGAYHGGYNGGSYQGNSYSKPATTPATASSTAPVASTTKPASKEEKKDTTVPSRPKTCIGNGWRGSANCQTDDDYDYDDPHGNFYQ